MASLQSFFILKLPTSVTNPTLPFLQNPHRIPSFKPSISPKKPSLTFKSLALTESDSPKSLESPDRNSLLQDLVDSFNLPADYLKQLPRDLRLDLNDAAFDLSNGQVIDECGQELGETLLNITRAWEAADTSTSATLISKLPLLVVSVTDVNKSALGRRLVSSGRRFQSMGQYGQGELQKIAKAMITTGKLLSASPVSNAINEEPTQDTRMFKFGDLQVELTPDKAYIGAAIGFGFGFLSWELSQSIQSIPESSLQYANDNALLLSKSLRGALLAICYSSTVLSAFTTVGLVILGGQLKSKQNINAAFAITNTTNYRTSTWFVVLNYILGSLTAVFLSWELSQGIQSIPESSLQYANNNALLLAKSLRGALLAICYSSTVLSACTTVGLVTLAGQLS